MRSVARIKLGYYPLPSSEGARLLVGFVNLLEACRYSKIGHLIYASYSSVYGSKNKLPFAIADPADHPISLYAATKCSNELIAHV